MENFRYAIICEINLILTRFENCVLTAIITQTGDPNADPAVEEIRAPTDTTFKTKDTKLYVPIVTLSTEDDNKLLEQLKTEFRRTTKWNKYRSETDKQTNNNNLNNLIDPTFSKVNRLFVLSFKNEKYKTLFSKYYTSEVEIKDFNVFMVGKRFSDVPINYKEETYEEIIEMSKNNDYTTGNLLDHEYFSKHYQLITKDLSKQTELENPDLKEKNNFFWKLEEDNEATMFFIKN